MKDEQDESSYFPYLDEQHAKKIRSVQEKLDQTATEESTQTPSAEHFLGSSHLAQALFAKAPPDFLERRTLDELVAITKNCLEALQDFSSGKSAIHASSEANSDHCCLYIAVGDRPFIINSIRECILDFGAKVHALIHPILIDEGYRTSFSYIEISKLSGEELQVLERRISRVLAHVVAATDDFTSMLVRVETLARVLDASGEMAVFSQAERQEVSAFLRWLSEGGFIFLGYLEWAVESEDSIPQHPRSQIGIIKSDKLNNSQILRESREDASSLIETNKLLEIIKLRTESVVQRRSRLTNIVVQEISPSGDILAVHSIIGLLTSKALAQESSSVPLIRQKLQHLLRSEQVIENSHDYKNIINIVDSMPKDEALRLDLESLRSVVHTVLGIQNSNETRVSIRFDPAKRGATVLIVMPRDRFNSEVRSRVQEHIEKVFGATRGTSEYYLDLSNKPHARFYFHIPISSGSLPPLDLARLEQEIANITRSWKDNLEEHVLESGLFSESSRIWQTFSNAFGEDYQALHSVEECVHDITLIESLTEHDPVRVSMLPAREAPPEVCDLIVYSLGSEITISRAFPILENSGVEVISERSSEVRPLGRPSVYIHRFLVRSKDHQAIARSTFEKVYAPGLADIFGGAAENDALNSLMLTAQLDVKAISLLRTYCAFLWQVTKFASRSAIFSSLADTPKAAQLFWRIFDIRFNPTPATTLEDREEETNIQFKEFRELLLEVRDITKDRILRYLIELLRNTLRTNFYLNTGATALKIHVENIDFMPHPKPEFEIFVRSQRMEGVHLRSGPIARGGIRWSNRHQDYRSEILGLVKTQKTKNALIVPTGAKGGFIVRHLPEDTDGIQLAVAQSYREFVRSLLSITDNRFEGKIERPIGVVTYDEDDPYLVVAADRGTATFSDIANRIATEEFQFWLGDAFASGGSEGYDHKLFGITARGTWESVKRHFNNIALDYIDGEFTVIGIGDMSGDVFGNGLLLSNRIKLLAAFNHKHIFIDPTPDPQASFQERQRLFQMPGSQWSDYNPDLLSPGGAIIERYAKEIELSPQALAALQISDSATGSLDGERLISYILRTPCDLLWNGGIGTYVKSRSESNADVEDSTNDRVRVDADQLRVRVIGEGGNLGLTQQARIDFARSGGQVHTDAIDNSAGVDLSDHEVNLKILFAELIIQGKLSYEERNQLLRDIAPKVVEEVLEHNKEHALQLTVGVTRSRRNIDYFRSLIQEVVKRGYVNRALEHLPEDEQLVERANRKEGLSKPELAICLASVKMWVKDELVASDLPNDALLKSYLIEYFPEKVREKYRDHILAHPLAHNIIATQASNVLIDTVGITFVHRMCLSHSARPVTVIKCALAAEHILRGRYMRDALRTLDTFRQNKLFLSLVEELNAALREATSWIISNHGHDLGLGEIVKLYQGHFDLLVEKADRVLVGEEKELHQLRYTKYTGHRLDRSVASSLAAFPRILSLFEMLWAAHESEVPIERVAHTYSSIISSLGAHSILAMEHVIEPKNKWEQELLVSAYQEIRRGLSTLTCELLKSGHGSVDEIVAVLRNSESYGQVHSTIEEVKEKTPNVAAISVIAKQIQIFRLRTRSEDIDS